MLVVSRKKNETIHIGDGIALCVAEIRGDKVRLGIVAPKEMAVHREEVWKLLRGRLSRAMLDPAWLAWKDGTVRRLARAIAEKGNYDALPILADALEEAGCSDADILGHCRSGGHDARSSWVIDLILAAS
jgi:carbon storage regulator CsrA